MQKRAYLISFLVIALLATTWAISPANLAAAQTSPEQNPASCREQAEMLPETLPEATKLRNRVREICNFDVSVRNVPARVTEFDRLFIENAIAANMLEIQSLEFALTQATDEEWRNLIALMIEMHSADLEMAMNVAEKIGANTNPDLTRARVYPGTALYDLGVRRANLVEMYLDPLMLGAGVVVGTPTALPTDMSTATGMPTDMATETATALPTDVSTATSVPTDTATDTSTPLPVDTATATGAATDTAAPTDVATETATNTATALPIDTFTATATSVPTDTASETATTVPTDAATTTATMVPTDVVTATLTVTAVPTTPPTIDNFDVFAMDIIADQHVMSLETALAAERLVRNPELRAFAKHSADMAKLHLLLIQDLKYRLAYNLMLPLPRFEEEYQGPRRLDP